MAPRGPLVQVAAVVVVANVLAVGAVSRRLNSRVRLKAKVSLVTRTLSVPRGRRDRAVVDTGRVARISNGTRHAAAIAAGIERFSKEQHEQGVAAAAWPATRSRKRFGSRLLTAI